MEQAEIRRGGNRDRLRTGPGCGKNVKDSGGQRFFRGVLHPHLLGVLPGSAGSKRVVSSILGDEHGRRAITPKLGFDVCFVPARE